MAEQKEVKESKVNQEKLKALQLTMDKIEKSYGKGAIMRMGDSVVENVPVIPSGSVSLNLAFPEMENVRIRELILKFLFWS